MYPSLSTRRRLLFALLVLGGKSTYSTLRSFLPISYAGPKFYAMLKRLEADGLIRRFHRLSSIVPRPSLRLLPAGIELLERRYGPRIRQMKAIRLSVAVAKPVSSLGSVERNTLTNRASQTQPLDDSWSLIILNFPTSQAYSRSRLTGRLLELGCGSLRDGVYISPYPILPAVAEWAEENACLDHIYLFISNQQPATSNKILAAWDLPALANRYLSLLDRLNIAKSISLPPKSARAQSRIKSDFLDLLIVDPLLPKPLLPADYPLPRVIGEITSLDKDISRDEIKIDNLHHKKLAEIRSETPSAEPEKS